MSKRDEIAGIIIPHLETSDTDYGAVCEDARGIANVILSTLTKDFEVVEECRNQCVDGFIEHSLADDGTEKRECPNCHGTGTINRQATWEEIMEALEDAFSVYNTNKWEAHQDNEMYFILKSGGRLRMKK